MKNVKGLKRVVFKIYGSKMNDKNLEEQNKI